MFAASPPSDASSADGHAPSGAGAIAVIVPCYRETAHILDVLAKIGPEVEAVYVIDDCCPDDTATLVEKQCDDPRVKVIRHDKNKGVGGATMTGYCQALADGYQVMVKMDGDGQMDGALIPRLIAPIIEGAADYTKGNRFHAFHGISEMPWSRIFGNLVLSLASKFSSGYWDILDPTNGFTAINAAALEKLQLERIAKGYYFESDMLFHLGMVRAVVRDVPMVAKYGAEQSGIYIPRIVPVFMFKHIANTCRRLLFSYFIRETNIASMQLIFGSLLVLFGVIFGAINWIDGENTGIPATAGTVVLAALPIILGSQALIAFINFDTRNLPTQPLQGLDEAPPNATANISEH
jgi:dolichol-phosphate mannosyltransferase